MRDIADDFNPEWHDDDDPEELAQQRADEAQEREEREFMGQVDLAEREGGMAIES